MTAAPDPAASPAAVSEAAIPRSEVDFNRPVVSILGLPFDAIGIPEAVQRIRAAAFAGRRCFVSTPNLNFAIAARTDSAFLGSVLRSDLCLVDGMPLVWIARLLGLPVRGRVSGSDVFEALHRHPDPPLAVYLFGGPPDAAARAADAINRRGGGLQCVGFDPAGFGSVESMSGAEQIARINRSGAHFVVVSLGAKKGQAWIEHNAPRLAAPVLSHLGAVLNFAAGNVRRAPRKLQSVGLEWLWRIREEPSLWRRYWNDGKAGMRILFTQVLPDAIASRREQSLDGMLPKVDLVRSGASIRLQVSGAWAEGVDPRDLRAAFAECAAEEKRTICVDLCNVERLNVAVVALLLLAKGWFERRSGFEIVGVTDPIASSLRRKLADRALLGNG